MQRKKKQKKPTPSEKETKTRVLALARMYGVEEQALKIMEKYDDAVKGAKDENERHHIAVCGLVELHNLIGCVGPLIVDGVEILPAMPGYEVLDSGKFIPRK